MVNFTYITTVIICNHKTTLLLRDNYMGGNTIHHSYQLPTYVACLSPSNKVR